MRCQITTRGVEGAIAELAARQHGVVERAQLLSLGVLPGAIDRRAAVGRLIRLHRGVYAVGHARLRPEGFRLAALLACGPGAALSHRSAAAEWDLLRDARRKTDVTVAPGSNAGRRLPQIIVHRAVLEPHEIREREGVLVTSPARTLLDLAATEPRRRVARVLDQALVLGLYDHREIDPLLRSGRRGAAVLRRILEERHPDAHRSRSELESIAIEKIAQSGLPRPEINAWLSDLGLEVDLLWRSRRLVVELDGRRYHWHRKARDAERDRILSAAGFAVQRYGWGDVVSGAFIERMVI